MPRVVISLVVKALVFGPGAFGPVPGDWGTVVPVVTANGVLEMSSNFFGSKNPFGPVWG